LIAQLLLYFRFEISCINSFHAQYYSTLLTLLHLFNCRVNINPLPCCKIGLLQKSLWAIHFTDEPRNEFCFERKK